jgi:hypothetical protein
MLRKIRATLARSNPAMLVVYVLFVIFPHFAAISHSHPGGDRPHTHSYLSLQNENLKRQVLVTLGDGMGLKTLSMPVTTQEEALPPLIPLERGSQGLQPTNFWHTHFQEDPNLLAWSVILGAVIFASPLRLRSALTKQTFPELAAFRALARGPPALSSSFR